jgi:diadenosine tetraphosphate (Ap4A) HIT family hydrolase
MSDVPCVFCQIIRGEAPASQVYRDDTVVAFLDIHPVNPGHVLVVPRRHAAHLADLDEKTGERIFCVAMRLARALRNADLRCEGVNFWLADGAPAGQEIFHVHLHVFPRFGGDGFGFRFPPDYGRRDRHELDAVASEIRRALEV